MLLTAEIRLRPMEFYAQYVKPAPRRTSS